MKFSEFAKNINALLESRPEVGEFDVVTSIDDEGNGFRLVHYEPSVGNYDEDGDFNEEVKANAICLN